MESALSTLTDILPTIIELAVIGAVIGMIGGLARKLRF